MSGDMQRDRLRAALHTHLHLWLANLDPNTSIDDVLSWFELVEYERGHEVLTRGANTDELMVIESGVIDEYSYDETSRPRSRVTSLHPGSTLGEIGLVYDFASNTSLIVRTDRARVWVCPVERFRAVTAEASHRLLPLFEQRCSQRREGADGSVDLAMTKKDFCEVLSHGNPHRTTEQLQNLLWKVAVKSRDNLITFNEFFELHMLLSLESPDCEWEIGFRLADRDRNGVISRQEFTEMLSLLYSQQAVRDLMQRPRLRTFFENSDSMTYGEFRRILRALKSYYGPTVRATLISGSVDTARALFTFDISERTEAIDIGEKFLVSEPKPTSLVGVNAFIAGAVAGAISRTATAPLDRLKILLQLRDPSAPHIGITEALRKMYREGGWRGCFRGNGVNILKIAPETAIKFYAFETIKRAMFGDEEITTGQRLVAGACAGGTSQVLIYPLEVLKTRLAAAPPHTYSGIFHCLEKIVSREGIRGLYRGVTPAVAGVIPYAGVDLAIFDSLKHWYRVRNQCTDIHPLVILAFGTVSSVTGQTVAYPLQLIRTRLQMQGLNGERVQGMWEVIQGVFRQRGMRGLYAGIGPNYLKAVPAVSISYVVYEETKRILCNFEKETFV